MLNKMEKLINKKNLVFCLILLAISFSVLFYFFSNSQNKNDKYFDVILAQLYNDEIVDYENEFVFLSSLKDSDISFFGDLKIASINNLEKYEKLDKEIILMKKAILDLELQNLKNLSSDENFIFKDIATIFLLNLDLDNYDDIFQDNIVTNDNFFMKAVNRYYNENN
tara:strand:- start:2064 stop:2564 length:501 start_codon:yes stop_codon:yes gene_type:complete